MIVSSSYTFLENSLLKIEDIFQNSSQSIHLARNELKIIQIQNVTTVVKSFKIPNIINQIVYSYFRDSKAKRSYEYSLKIKEFTPKPIGYIEFFSYGLLKNSYFISEHFNYDFTIREPLLDKNFKDREAIFKAFALFTLELHNNNIYHHDYSPGNILIQKKENSFVFKIVDINRMTFGELTENERAENFSKLWTSEEILTIIADEYTLHYKCSKNFTKKVIYYSQQHKKIKNFKNRLKGKPIIEEAN